MAKRYERFPGELDGVIGQAEMAAEIERLHEIIVEAGSTLNAALAHIPPGIQHDDAAEVVEKCAGATDKET